MNSLKINSINNINSRSAKNIGRPAKSVANKMLASVALGGSISLGINSREQAKRYNEIEPDNYGKFREDLINRIMNLNTTMKEKSETGNEVASEEITKSLRLKSFEEGRLPDFNETDYGDDFYDELNNMDLTNIGLADFKKKSAIIKNRQLKKITETICKKKTS